MRTVILELGALEAIAASVGIHDREALTKHLGMELDPITPHLIATILTRLPAKLSDVCSVEEMVVCGKIVA